MTEQIRNRLSSVRTRQHRLVLLRYAAAGLLLGSVFTMFLAVARTQGGVVRPWGAILASIAGMLGGVALGWFRVPAWKESAEAVDAHYRLKDRSTSALEFSENPNATKFHQLQLRDAIEHLDIVNAEEVVPFQVPRILPVAAIGFVAVVAFAMVPIANRSADADVVGPLALVVEEAEFLEETMLDDLKELADEFADELADEADTKELEELTAQLDELLQEIKEKDVDEREALAKFSQMQAAVAAAQAEFNMDTVDAQMHAMGKAMASSTAMRSASRALQEGDYKKAADKLDRIDASAVGKTEAKRVAKDLKKLSQAMSDVGLGELSNATSEVGEGLDRGNVGKYKRGAREIAKLSRKYALRKKVGECLGCQLARLGECKANCNGGNAQRKASRPSNGWGKGSTGTPFGDEATQLDSTRRQETIRGTAGNGPSDREVTHSPEGRERATRAQRQVYKEYRKRAEEVLQNEALPLGHRQTIRQYFESIRPENGDTLGPKGEASEAQ